MRKFLLGAALSMALCLSSCYNGNEEAAETTVPTEAAAAAATAAAETTAAEKNAETEETAAKKDDNIEQRLTYMHDYLEVNMEYFENAEKILSELDGSDLSTVKYLTLKNASDTAAVTELAENCPNLETLRIEDSEYFSAQAEEYIKSLPKCRVTYSSGKDPEELTPQKGETGFFVRPCVTPFDEDWRNELEMFFTNFTDTDITASELKIYRMNGDDPEAVPFADGNYTYNIDMEIPAGEGFKYYDGHDKASLLITEDIFPFKDYANNRMRASLELGGKVFEMDFIISSNEALPFLDEEQQAAFDAAYDAVDAIEGCDLKIPEGYAGRPAEELIQYFSKGLTYEFAKDMVERSSWIIDGDGNIRGDIDGSRGGDIWYEGHYFSPVYMSENECILKNTIVSWHGDCPYGLMFDDYNYHMIKTDEGWKFDNFRIWY